MLRHRFAAACEAVCISCHACSCLSGLTAAAAAAAGCRSLNTHRFVGIQLTPARIAHLRACTSCDDCMHVCRQSQTHSTHLPACTQGVDVKKTLADLTNWTNADFYQCLPPQLLPKTAAGAAAAAQALPPRQPHEFVPGAGVGGRDPAPCPNYEHCIVSWERQAAYVDWAIEVRVRRASRAVAVHAIGWLSCSVFACRRCRPATPWRGVLQPTGARGVKLQRSARTALRPRAPRRPACQQHGGSRQRAAAAPTHSRWQACGSTRAAPGSWSSTLSKVAGDG